MRKKWVNACIRISPPESADLRSAWLLNRSADRFSEFCSDFRNQPSSMLESSGCTLETDRLADSMRKPEGRACRCQRAVPCWKTGSFGTHSGTQWVPMRTTTSSLFLGKVRKIRGFVCGRAILHSWIGLDVKPPSHLTIVWFYKFSRQLWAFVENY